jgi:hypothetical protein
MKQVFFTMFLSCAVVSMYAQTAAQPTKPAPAATQQHDHNHDHNHDHPHEGEGKQQNPPNPNAPKITFKEEVYDFKEVPEGPQVTHEFVFTNTGKEPLVLSNVRASCGCTTPSWPKEPVLPGKEGTIVVTYNTQGRPGPFTKTVTITSNADVPEKVITIKGEVIKDDPDKSVPKEQPSMLSPKN